MACLPAATRDLSLKRPQQPAASLSKCPFSSGVWLSQGHSFTHVCTVHCGWARELGMGKWGARCGELTCGGQGQTCTSRRRSNHDGFAGTECQGKRVQGRVTVCGRGQLNWGTGKLSSHRFLLCRDCCSWGRLHPG